MKLPRYLLWLDLETTGSEPDADILEVGAILTDQYLRDLFTFERVVDGDAWKIREDIVKSMHAKSGLLTASVQQTAQAIGRVDAQLAELIDARVIRTERIALAGSGVSHFDRRYVERDMPEVTARLLHYSIDIGHVRRLAALAGFRMPFKTQEKTHRALDDVKLHLDEGRRWARLFNCVHEIARMEAD